MTDSIYKEIIELSDSLWDKPEIRLQENFAVEQFVKILKEKGFKVETDVYGFKTAIRAEYGSGQPVIGYLGEYDALPGLSQRAECCLRDPLVNDGAGHGCGHNLLGSASLLAAILAKRFLEKKNKEGTVVFYGCPAEEGISAKAWMVKAGGFKDLDAAFTWHPGNANMVMPCWALASIQKSYSYTGKASHAAQAPEAGRNALNAVQLLNIGANFYREGMPKGTMFHFAIVDGGGDSVNIIQEKAEIAVQIRGESFNDVKIVADQLDIIADSAARMTGTECEKKFIRGCSDLLLNDTLNNLIYDVFEKVGTDLIDDNDLKLANDIRKTFNNQDLDADVKYLKECFETEGLDFKEIRNKPILDFLYPRKIIKHGKIASSDTGDVSQIVPLAHVQAACFAQGTRLHSWQLVAQGKAPLAHKAIIKVGEVLSAAGIELIRDKDLMAKVKDEFKRRRASVEYVEAIPDGARLNK